MVGGSQRILAGGDGGRLWRTTDAGVTWQFAVTPTDYTHTLLDIEFHDDQNLNGFAVGRGGRVLSTTDGGSTWSNFGAIVRDASNAPATLWAVHAFSNTIVMVAGLGVLKSTVNGGATWTSLGLYAQGSNYQGTALDPAEFEFYELTAVGTLGGFRAIAAAEWEPPGQSGHGVVFATDAADPQSVLGRRWMITLDDATYPGSSGNMVEPWSVAFERGATPAQAVGYVFGGVGANGPGTGYRTTDGGFTWATDWQGGPTPYDVTAEPGRAMVAAYSGVVLRRIGANNWFAQTLPGPVNGVLTPGFSTAALGAVDSADGDNYVFGGGFGVLQRTTDNANNFLEASPLYAMDVEEQRLMDIAADPNDAKVAWAVGQNGAVLKTTDTGCTWTYTNFGAGFGKLASVAFWNSSDGIAAGLNSAGISPFLYSADSGNTWTAASVTSSQPIQQTLIEDVTISSDGSAWATGRTTGTSTPVVFAAPPPSVGVALGSIWLEVNSPLVAGQYIGGIVWPEPNVGLLVGWTAGVSDTPVAFRGSTATGSLVWTPVSLPVTSGRLLAIAASNGTVVSGPNQAVIIASGDDGMVLVWNATLQRFDLAPQAHQMLDTDLSALDVSKLGDHVLIGARYDTVTTRTWLGYALCLRNGTWQRIRALTGKDAAGISLRNATDGWVVGQASEGPGDHPSLSFDFGNLADSIILRYVPNAL